jgi:hypothetical protein
MDSYIVTYIHAYTHKYIHTYMYTYCNMFGRMPSLLVNDKLNTLPLIPSTLQQYQMDTWNQE